MYSDILACVDGSEGAARALDTAIKLAGLMGSTLHILCVYKHHSALESSLSMVRPYKPSTPEEALHEFATEVVTEAKEKAQTAGIEPEAHVRRGMPARQIVEYARKHAINAIVLGGRGIGDNDGFLLGSVSHKVNSLAECTCITVK